LIPRLYPSVSLENLLSSLEKAPVTISGEPATNFEHQLSNFIGAKYSLALTSGRGAIYLAVQILGLAQGDEVLVPSFTCPAVVDALVSAGVKPVIVDLQLPTYQLDLDSIKHSISNRTKAIIPTAYFGLPINIAELAHLGADHKLAVLVDMAQGLVGDGRFSEVAFLALKVPTLVMGSFNLDKHLPLGGGGFLSAYQPKLTERLMQVGEELRIHNPQEEADDLAGMAVQLLLMSAGHYENYLAFDTGRELIAEGKVSLKEATEICSSLSQGEFPSELAQKTKSALLGKKSVSSLLRRGISRLIPGYPSKPPKVEPPRRMSKLKGDLGMECLNRLSTVNARRAENASLIDQALSGLEDAWSPPLGEESSSLLRYPLVLKRSDLAIMLTQKLSRAGFEVGPFNYPQPLHRIPTYKKHIRIGGDLLISERIAEGMVNLPTWPGLKVEQLQEMNALIMEHLGGGR